jgi:hypothetical protein
MWKLGRQELNMNFRLYEGKISIIHCCLGEHYISLRHNYTSINALEGMMNLLVQYIHFDKHEEFLVIY